MYHVYKHTCNLVMGCFLSVLSMPSFFMNSLGQQNKQVIQSGSHDVIKWKHFPRYWPFVWGIHQSRLNSPHKGQRRGAFIFSLICTLNKRLSKQSWGWWFETLLHSLWCHWNDYITVEYNIILHTSPQWPRQSNNKESDPQKTPHSLP